MKCPYCGNSDTRVIDSRPAEEGNSIRRRRECLACTRRFTTYEHIESVPLVVIKKDGKRQVFVDGFWKHDDYPNAPKPGWSYEKLVKEREKLAKDLNEGLHSIQTLPARKFGLLTRRIKKIDRILKSKKK